MGAAQAPQDAAQTTAISPLAPPHPPPILGRAFPKVNVRGGGTGLTETGAAGAASAAGVGGGQPATSVHELLECPVCTNSLLPVHRFQMGLRPDLWISMGNLGACSVGGGPSEEQHRGMACAAAKEGERDDSGGDENFGRSLAKPVQQKTAPHLVFHGVRLGPLKWLIWAWLWAVYKQPNS